MIVYALINTVTGKRYIGMTEKSLARRWIEHKTAAKAGAKTILYAAIRKYGAKSFEPVELARILPGFSRKVLCEVERLLIEQEGTLSPNGYNMTSGGDGLPKGEGNPNLGKKASLDHIAKCKASWTPERRAVASAARAEKNRLMNQTDEHKAKLKAAWARAPERREKASKMLTELQTQPVFREKTAAYHERRRHTS